MKKENYKVSFSQKGERYRGDVEIISNDENLNECDKINSVAEQVNSIVKDSSSSEVENIVITKN
ncbi:hypothetical protein [Prevotella sp.]|uniref:hypothetical protein n=1 Tax=Prevotella sp. TaxID=59823 RepID=UPI00307B59C9